MILKLRQRMMRDESGFTLVELLVVMLILGLLAAIAIPAFFNQRDKAKDADAKAAVRTAQTAMETYSTDHDGNYASASATDLQGIEPTLSTSVKPTITVVSTDGSNGYEIKATSETGNEFTIIRNGGALSYPCTTNGDAGCPDSSFWAKPPPPPPPPAP